MPGSQTRVHPVLGIGRKLLAEPDQVIGCLCLFLQGHVRIEVIMRVVVITGVIALFRVIDTRNNDFLRLFDVIAAVFPVIDILIPSLRLLLHDDIHAVRQVAGGIVIRSVMQLIHGKGRVILIRAAVLHAVPFHAVNGIQVVEVERL